MADLLVHEPLWSWLIEPEVTLSSPSDELDGNDTAWYEASVFAIHDDDQEFDPRPRRRYTPRWMHSSLLFGSSASSSQVAFRPAWAAVSRTVHG